MDIIETWGVALQVAIMDDTRKEKQHDYFKRS